MMSLSRLNYTLHVLPEGHADHNVEFYRSAVRRHAANGLRRLADLAATSVAIDVSKRAMSQGQRTSTEKLANQAAAVIMMYGSRHYF